MEIITFLMFFSVIISAVVIAIGIQKRNAPKSFYFIILSLLNALFVTGRYFEATATCLETALLGTILGYLGMPFVPAFMLFFIMDYYDIKPGKWLQIPLLIPPSIATLLVATPQLRKFYYSAYSYYPGPPIAQLMVEGTGFYYLFFGYITLVVLACLGLSLWGARKFSKTERWPSLAVFFATLLPGLAAILYTFKLTPLKLDLSQFAISGSIALVCVAVYRMNLLKILPLAKDTILEQMSDAFIILDYENRYVESNSAAQRIFPALSDMRIGQRVDINDLFPQQAEGPDGRKTVSVAADGAQQHYHLSRTELLEKGKKLGICYTLHDETDTRKLLAELKSMATYDSLTGIYNRASFHELAAGTLEIARAQKTPVSALEIDIDFFKIINDTYGHFCGDEIIKSLVNIIAANLENSDIFGRVGGEEFNVMLPNTDLNHAVALAQNLQKTVEAESFMFGGQQIPVTISIGVAVFDAQRHTDLERLLIDADNALYESKETGRNKVCFYRPAHKN